MKAFLKAFITVIVLAVIIAFFVFNVTWEDVKNFSFSINQNPTVSITTPKEGAVYKIGDQVEVKWRKTKLPDNSRTFVEFENNSLIIHSSATSSVDPDLIGTSASFTIPEKIAVGKYTPEGFDPELGNPYTVRVVVYKLESDGSWDSAKPIAQDSVQIFVQK